MMESIIKIHAYIQELIKATTSHRVDISKSSTNRQMSAKFNAVQTSYILITSYHSMHWVSVISPSLSLESFPCPPHPNDAQSSVQTYQDAIASATPWDIFCTHLYHFQHLWTRSSSLLYLSYKAMEYHQTSTTTCYRIPQSLKIL